MKKFVMIVGCLLSVLLGMVTGKILLDINVGSTLVSGIVSITGFLGYIITDSVSYYLFKDKETPF